MREWIEPPDVEAPKELQTAIGGCPLVAKALTRRGFANIEAAGAFLNPDLYRPASPYDLPNLAKAVERLDHAIRQGETICVWGDFDVDGQTATTLLVSTLRDLGAAVQYHVPIRETESHGVNLPVLEHYVADGVDVVVTCDTGVSAHEAITYAQAQGVDVIVTDHHDLPSTLPQAYAVVNPKMLPLAHPLRELPGVGCAYKLAEALYDRGGQPEGADRHHDLVALGIVADVAVQTRDTRYLLQRGLEALRHTERLGLQVMIKTALLNPDQITEEHIGFVIAPRLNALGRLADASDGVELLSTRNLTRAGILVAQIEGLNARRKLLCDQVMEGAQAQLERDRSLLDAGALVLSHPSWPAGVIGIVAGRLAERYNRPAVLITTPPDGLGRGSARSIEGCDISAAIGVHGGLLEGFGGHPMAAGFSIDPERIPEFRRALSRTVREKCGEMREQPSLKIDGYLDLAALDLATVEELARLAPFGPGNPPLTLVSERLFLKAQTTIGSTGEHLRLVVEDETGRERKVIWWQWNGSPLPAGRFDLAYLARASNYRGQREVQVEWVDARPIEEPPARRGRESDPLTIVDWRPEADPHKLLSNLRAHEQIQVWSESGAKAETNGLDRRDLRPGKTLVIWTTPPGPGELHAALDKVWPETIYLVGIDPECRRSREFLQRLASLAKHALRHNQGWVSITVLAAATAQREAAVEAGLGWLVARGHLAKLVEDGDRMQLAVGSQSPGAGKQETASRLRALLEEAAAYRAYFSRADREALIRQMGAPPSWKHLHGPGAEI